MSKAGDKNKKVAVAIPKSQTALAKFFAPIPMLMTYSVDNIFDPIATYIHPYWYPVYKNRPFRYVLASLFSVGKIISAAGQAYFGMKKVFAHLETVRKIFLSVAVKDFLFAEVIAGAIIINVLNRATAIFESLIITKDDKTLEEAISETESEDEAPDTETDYETDIEDFSHAAHPENATDAGETEEEINERGWFAWFLQYMIFYSITAGAGISACFASANAYLGGLNFFAYVAGIDLDNDDIDDNTRSWLVALSIFVAVSSCWSNFAYNFPPSKNNSKRFADWITDPTVSWGEVGVGTQEYLPTIILCGLNIFSEPCFAFFSTKNLAELIKLGDYFSASTVQAICAGSTLTQFTSNLFSALPSSHDRLNPNPVFKLGVDQLDWKGSLYNKVGKGVGISDSIWTGGTISVAVLTTLHDLAGINQLKFRWTLLALSCGASKIFTTYAFSVCYGLENRLKKYYPEIFLMYAQRMKHLYPTISPVLHSKVQGGNTYDALVNDPLSLDAPAPALPPAADAKGEPGDEIDSASSSNRSTPSPTTDNDHLRVAVGSDGTIPQGHIISPRWTPEPTDVNQLNKSRSTPQTARMAIAQKKLLKVRPSGSPQSLYHRRNSAHHQANKEEVARLKVNAKFDF